MALSTLELPSLDAEINIDLGGREMRLRRVAYSGLHFATEMWRSPSISTQTTQTTGQKC